MTFPPTTLEKSGISVNTVPRANPNDLKIAGLIMEEMHLRQEYERIPRRRAEIAAELIALGLTQQEVGDLMGLSKQRVSAMLKREEGR